MFGEVIRGQEIVHDIENMAVDAKSRPSEDIRVSNCGELVLKQRTKGISK